MKHSQALRIWALGVVLVALVAFLWPRPISTPPVPVQPPLSAPIPQAPPVKPVVVDPVRPLPLGLQVRYSLPVLSGDLGSTGLRTPDAREMTKAEQDFFARVQRGSLHVEEVAGLPALRGPVTGFRGATVWDEILERWVDPRLKRSDGLGFFRPDATYEAVRLPFQQEESGFSLGLKYRWSF